MIVRPGSSTANAILMREAMKAGSPMVDLKRIWRGRITHEHLTAAALTQSLNLRTLFAASNPIPDHIMVEEVSASLEEVLAGGAISAAVVIVGENDVVNDDDGYLTSTNVFTGASLGWKDTPAAALRAPRYRAAFTPLVAVTTTTANVVAATSFVLDVSFKYSLMLSRRAA